VQIRQRVTFIEFSGHAPHPFGPRFPADRRRGGCGDRQHYRRGPGTALTGAVGTLAGFVVLGPAVTDILAGIRPARRAARLNMIAAITAV